MKANAPTVPDLMAPEFRLRPIAASDLEAMRRHADHADVARFTSHRFPHPFTEADAARQRGIAVLADTGQQIEVSLRLPVLAETGIIEPGAFVEYQDGSVTRLGLVRSTQIEAGMPEVWQTLGVQSHA